MIFPVSITHNSDTNTAVREAIALLGSMRQFVSSGQRVLIKPNNITTRYVPGTVTSAEVVAAVALLVKEAGGHPVIGEHGLSGDAENSCAWRYQEALAALGLAGEVALVDFARDEMISVQLPQAKALKTAKVAKSVLDADSLIDLPVLKTHDQTQVTLGIKNMKGCLSRPDMRHSHALGVEQAIVDVCAFLHPTLTIIDGMTAAEGMGPVGGTPVPMDLIIAGANPLAVDIVGARVMGFNEADIHFLRNAIASGMGPKTFDEIHLLGQSLESVRRPFITAQSVVLKQYAEMGITVISHNACCGCWAEFRHIYYSLGEQRSKLAGMTFVLGQVETAPLADNIVYLGNCSKAVATPERFVPGCPPHHTEIERLLCEIAEVETEKINRYET